MIRTSTCLFGLGSDYGDDRVGWRVLELIPIGFMEMQLIRVPLQMLEQSESYSRWIIVDAIAQHDHYGEILTWRWPNLPQLSPICCNTHAYSFLEVLELARALGRLPTIVDVWGISVDMHTCQSEKMGAPLSPAVELAAQELARRLQHEFAWSPTSDSGDIYA